MKKLIAVGLIGLFSLVMVGTVFASFDSKASIELKKDISDINVVAILDGVSPTITSFKGKMIALVVADQKQSEYNPDVKPRANDPPTIRML